MLPLIVASPLLVFWGLAEWSSRRELARVRAAFAPHAGPVATRDMREQSVNDIARQLAAIVARIGITMEGERGLARNDPKSKARELARRTAREELDRTGLDLAPSDPEARAAIDVVAPTLAEVRALVLAGPPPRWRSARGATGWYEMDLGGKLALVDLLLGDAFERQRDADATTALADLDAAWLLVESLRECRSVYGALIARAAASHVAVAARKVTPLPPEWDARFDIEPFRVDMLEALRSEALDSLDAARLADMQAFMQDRNSEAPPWMARMGLVLKPTFRKQLARQVEVNIPVIATLEDPSRCGPATLAALRAAPREDAALDGIFFSGTPYASVPRRLDATRVQFELTRRLIALRARRDADPEHRWPEDFEDDGSSSCPGVRFRLVSRGAELLVLEAESQDGPWWEGEDSKQRPARVEIWRAAKPQP